MIDKNTDEKIVWMDVNICIQVCVEDCKTMDETLWMSNKIKDVVLRHTDEDRIGFKTWFIYRDETFHTSHNTIASADPIDEEE